MDSLNYCPSADAAERVRGRLLCSSRHDHGSRTHSIRHFDDYRADAQASLIAGAIVMVDTDFGRRGSCEVTRVGYDSYVDGEWVERVDEVVYVGDCEGEDRGGRGEPAGIVNWD